MKSEEVRSLLKSLGSARLGDGTSLSALHSIRKNVMATKPGIQLLVKLGCIQSLLTLLYRHVSCEHEGVDHAKKGTSEGGVSVAVSIVSNLLMEREARKQVKRDGIETLGTILAEFSTEEIQVRSCRALGNLAMDAGARLFIAQARVAPTIIKLLEVRYVDAEEKKSTAETLAGSEKTRAPSGSGKTVTTDDAEDMLETLFPSLSLVQAACRTLRYLIDEVKVRQQMIDGGVVWALAVLIKSDNTDMVACVIRVLSELWMKMNKKITERMSSEMVRAGVMRKVIEMVHSEDETLSHQAFTVLLPLTQYPHAAALIGASDGVPFFLDLLTSSKWQTSQKEILSGLCQLAKEAVNRVKIREGGGLKVFLKTLQDDDMNGVHDRVISSLVSFLYDDASMNLMLEDGLTDVLLLHLQHCGGYRSRSPVNFCQDARELLEFAASETVAAGGQSSSALHEPVSCSITGFISEDSSEYDCLSSTSKACSDDDEATDEVVIKVTGCDSSSGQILPGSGNAPPSSKNVDASQKKEGNRTELADDCEVASTGIEVKIEEKLTVSVTSNVDMDTSGIADSSECDTVTDTQMNCDKGYTYSMNSPSYRPETTWHMDNYHPGITCKSFHPSNPYMSPTAGSSCSEDSSTPGSPYSPLTAESYYSPPNVNRFSPAYSSVASSPAYSYSTLSPARSVSDLQLSSPVYSGPLSPGGTSAGICSPLSLPHGSPSWSTKSSPAYTTVNAGAGLLFSSSEEDSCDVDDISTKYFMSSSKSAETPAPSELSTTKDTPHIAEQPVSVSNAEESCELKTVDFVSNRTQSQGFEIPHIQQSTDTKGSCNENDHGRPLLPTQGPKSEKELASEHFTRHRKSPQNSNKGPTTDPGSDAAKHTSAVGEGCNQSSDQVKTSTVLPASVDVSCEHATRQEKSSPDKCSDYLPEKHTSKPYDVSFDHAPNAATSPLECMADTESSDHQSSGRESDRHSGVRRFLETASDDGDDDKTPTAKRKRRMTKHPSQYAAVTQNNILILLSRLSVREDLNKQLANSKVVHCLLDHLARAQEPQDRCVRILFRIMSSPHCLDLLLTMCAPAMIIHSLLLDPVAGIKLQAMGISRRKKTSFSVTDVANAASRARLFRYHSVEEGSWSLTESSEVRRSVSTDERTVSGSVASSEAQKDDRSDFSTKSKPAHGHSSAGESGHQTKDVKQGQNASTQGQDKPVDLCRTGVHLLDEISHQTMLPYGEGVVSHVLLRHTAFRQLVFATSLLFLLPYQTRERRQQVLFSRGVLDKVLSALSTPITTSQTVQEAVATGLVFLLQHLQPSFRFDPQDTSALFQKAINTLEQDDQAEPCQVKADGTHSLCLYAKAKKDLYLRAGKSKRKLGANRSMMMRRSSVFSAMLQGSYIESKQSEITIEGAASDSLKFILHFLHGCREGCSVMQLGRTDTTGAQTKDKSQYAQTHPELCPDVGATHSSAADSPSSFHFGQHDLHRCLSTINLADRFLLPELTHYLCSVISCRLLTRLTAAEVFQFAAFHGLKDLAEDSMQVLLLSPQPLAHTCSQLIELAQSQVGSEVKACIIALVRRGVAMAD